MTGPHQNIFTTAAIPKADIQSDPIEISLFGLDLWSLCHESPQLNLRFRQLAAHGEAWRATTIWILEFWLEIQVDKTKTLEVSSCRICFLRCNGVVEKALCLDKSGKGWNDQLRSLQNYNVVNPIHRIVAERKTTSTLFVFTPPPCNNDDWRNDADVVAVRNGCTFTGWTGRFDILRQNNNITIWPAAPSTRTLSRSTLVPLTGNNIFIIITHKPQDTGWFMLVPSP